MTITKPALPKDHFQFKQFGIDQKGSTLKVCTDSCLFGAWVASHLSLASNVLDIGTGTGLLALMVAQKHPDSTIAALEIDLPSAALASQNVQFSPWKEKVTVYPISLQTFTPPFLFDCVLSNPPFFENQLTSDQRTNNLAKHHTGLTKEELLENVLRLLAKEGVFYVLFPEAEGRIFQKLAISKQLFLREEVLVRNKKEGPVFRVMQQYGFVQQTTKMSEMIIYEAHQQYTPEFVALLGDYYLYL